MFENIAYIGLGFAAVFLGLELAWHFTACKIHDKSIKPCFYKEVGLLKQKDVRDTDAAERQGNLNFNRKN